MKRLIFLFILVLSFSFSSINNPGRPSLHERGQEKLSTPNNTTTVTANTYIKIDGVFIDGSVSGFSLDPSGILTYTGNGGAFLFNGVSDLEVNKASTTTYGLFLNGVLLTGAETPHDFTAASKTESISITSIIVIASNGDEFEVYGKSSEANTIITVKTLQITFWGE